ncbi:DNA polymerase [Tunturiibacter empetritectus]|uniref:Y-family DNA polymerase n=1 Tax=Tunturiibacter empetritectus TaxID=3069691 RepID=UPI003D9B0DF3
MDLNSFFASVEQQLHPEYRGRPLAVVPTMADTTSCIAASYEAKALGIKTGTQVGEAKKSVPTSSSSPATTPITRSTPTRSPRPSNSPAPSPTPPPSTRWSASLIGREQEPPRARKIALEIKQSIYKNVGEALRCSIGMAPNRYLAKIASDMQKPDGLIGLLPSQLPRAIAHLDLRDLPGVGARTEVRLNAKGITTMEQLLALDRNGMHKLWDSVWGDRLYHWLRGANTGDDGAPVSTGIQKSLGHSHVLAPEFRSHEGSWAVAHKLLHKAAMRLRMEKFYTNSLTVSIRFALTKEQTAHIKSKRHTSGIKHSGWAMEARFRECQDTLTLLEALRGVWAQRPQGGHFTKPFFVGVTLRNLIPEDEHQPELFADPNNRADLSATMDKLNLKYGHTTLHFAGMLPARESAPTRIAFTQIPVQYGVDYM